MCNTNNALISWIKDFKTSICFNGFYLIKNILQVTHNDKDTWTLVIKNVRQKDGGEYMCQVNSVPMVSQVILEFHNFQVK